jgi:PAS domain S-box-containing protein
MKKVRRKSPKPKQEDPLAKIEHLESRLAEAEETLRAIRSGEVDALAIETATGPQIFTLKGADYAYQMIVENINEGAITLLQDGTIGYANRRFANMLGLGLEKIIGSFFHSFVNKGGKEDFLGLLGRSLTGKQKGEFLLSTARGEYLPVAVSTNPLHVEEQIAISVIITDLTEQKKREDRLDFEVRKRTAELEEVTAELKAQNEELLAIQQRLEEEQRALEESAAKLYDMNKELESFSYSVSHDLRAPLRAIDGYARLILKKQGDKFDADTARKFNDIRSNAQMMGQLIDNLLTFSRLGRKAMSLVLLDMDILMKDTWKEVRASDAERNINLRVESMPPCYGDRALIKQILINLLSNAVKFTKYKDAAEIVVGGSVEGNEIVYYVKDNGAGFDMAYYDKLFGVFQRLHGMEQFEGTGIGLATVQRIIRRHNGRVWAEGKVDEGATFYFSLPSSHTHTIGGETVL